MAIGAAVFIIGFAASGFKFKSLSTDDYNKKEQTFSSDFKAIEIDESDTNINIGRSDDNNIHITYFENKNEKYDISESDTLKIKKKSSGIFKFGFSTQITYLNIDIPEKCKASIIVDSDNSNVKAENINTKSFKICVDDGNININKLNADGNSDISTKSGNIKFSESEFTNDFSVKTSDGNISSENCSYKEKSDYKTDNGNVTLKDITCSSEFKLKTSDGNVKADNCEYNKKAEIKTGCGNVTLNTITCLSDFSVKTSDGNVKGTINGSKKDFNILTDTGDGSNNLDDKNNGKDKTLNIKTGCGNIKIDFQD